MRRTAADAHTVHLWSLSEDVVIDQSAGDDQVVLTSRWGTEFLDRPDPMVREALRRMELGPVLLANASPGKKDRQQESEADSDVYLVMLPTLSKLSHLVVRTLGLDDLMGPLLSVFPVAPYASFELDPPPGRQAVRLPSHVVLTVLDSGFSLESVASPHRVVLHRPEAALVVAMLAWPVTLDSAAAALPLPPQVTDDIIGYLAAAGMAAPVDPDEFDGEFGEESGQAPLSEAP